MGVYKFGDVFFPGLVPFLSGSAATTPEYHRHLMVVLLLLPSAQVRGLEAARCPTSRAGVSVGIPRDLEFSGKMFRDHLGARQRHGPFVLLCLTRLDLIPRFSVGVPFESWETGSNHCPFTHTGFQHLSVGEATA